MARAHHGARPARRRRVPRPLSGHPLRPGRRVRAALRGRRVRHRLLERGDRARGRTHTTASVRLGGAPGRSPRVHHDAEPPVSDRGAHATAARALAPRCRVAPRVPRGREGVRDRCAPPHAADLRIALSGQGPDRQPRHDAGGDRRLAHVASSESRSASSSWGSPCTTSRWRNCGSSACGERGSTSPLRGRRRSSSSLFSSSRGTCVASRLSWPRTFSRRATRSSSPSTGSSRRTCSAGTRPRAASCSRSVTTCFRSPRTRSAGSLRSRGRSAAGSEASSCSPRSVVAVVGLLDLTFVSLQAWRDSGVPGWYGEQLGLDYEGLSGLPENWVYNTGDEENPIRRLVSTFLSPLASAYALVVALIYVVSRPLRWWWAALAALLYVALLYTHTRAAFAALAFGLVVLAVRAAASRAGGARASRRSPPARSSSSPTRRSGRPRATRPTSSSSFARTRGRRALRSGAGSPPRTRPRTATGATCETACES